MAWYAGLLFEADIKVWRHGHGLEILLIALYVGTLPTAPRELDICTYVHFLDTRYPTTPPHLASLVAYLCAVIHNVRMSHG
jgi:hypothetical protein